MDNKPAETDTGHPENIEMRNMNEEEEEEEEQRQQETNLDEQEADINRRLQRLRGQQENPQQNNDNWEQNARERLNNLADDDGGEINVENDKKAKLFDKEFGLKITPGIDPVFFNETKIYTYRVGKIRRIEYRGVKILRRITIAGKLEPYKGPTEEQQNALSEFNEKKERVDRAIQEVNLDRELQADGGLGIEQIDEANRYFNEVQELFDNAGELEKERVITPKMTELKNKITELEGKKEKTDNDKKMLKKYKQVFDKIRIEVQGLDQEYSSYARYRDKLNDSDIIRLLKNIKEKLRTNLPVVGAIVAIVAGGVSIVIAVLKLTGKGITAAAKATHETGKGIARFLAKLGPIMASIGSFVISLMSYLARGLMFIASNLWILLLALLGFLYNEYSKRRK